MSLSFRRSVKELYNATAAGAGAWVPLDTGFVNTYNALYSVSLEANDWVTIQIRIEDLLNRVLRCNNKGVVC